MKPSIFVLARIDASILQVPHAGVAESGIAPDLRSEGTGSALRSVSVQGTEDLAYILVPLR